MTPRQQRAALIDYLQAKVAIGDWHRVADAACDLRVLEAAHPDLAFTTAQQHDPINWRDDKPSVTLSAEEIAHLAGDMGVLDP